MGLKKIYFTPPEAEGCIPSLRVWDEENLVEVNPGKPKEKDSFWYEMPDDPRNDLLYPLDTWLWTSKPMFRSDFQKSKLPNGTITWFPKGKATPDKKIEEPTEKNPVPNDQRPTRIAPTRDALIDELTLHGIRTTWNARIDTLISKLPDESRNKFVLPEDLVI